MKNRKCIYFLIFIFVISIFIYKIYSHLEYNNWGWVSTKTASSDLEECVNYLQIYHPMCWIELPHDTKELYEELKQKYDNHSFISGYREFLDLERFTASLQDGHTMLSIYPNGKFFRYLEPAIDKTIPEIELDYLDNTLYLYDQNKKYEIETINGISAKKVIEKCTTYIPSENVYAIKQTVRNLKQLSTLVKLDLAKSMNKKMTISFYDGTTLRKRSYKFKNIPKEKKESWDSEFNVQKDYAVLTINECINSEEFRNYLNHFFKVVYSNHIHHVAIDLRNNPGGNSLYPLFFQYLPGDTYIIPQRSYNKPLKTPTENTWESPEKSDYIFKGNLYILSSVYTYSSARELTNILSINNLATVIGEPSSNASNSYGDIKILEFDNKNFWMQISKYYFYISPSLNESSVDIMCPEKEAYQKFLEVIEEK